MSSLSSIPSFLHLPYRGRKKGQARTGTIDEVTTVHHHRIQCCVAACFLLVDGQQVLLFSPTDYRMVITLLEHLGEAVPFEDLVEGSFDLQRDRGLFGKHMTAIRASLRPLGLTVRCVNNYGYLVQVASKQ